MKKTSKIAALFMAAVLTVALATGCSQQSSEQSTTNSQSASSETVDNLTIAISADENTLTPFTYVHGSPGFDAMSLIYDTLFVRSPDNTIIPWMVKDYSIENDSKVYYITLEDGLKWHDGQPLTAEDVKFTFEYVLTQSKTRFSAIGKKVESIDVKNDKELTITLKETDVNFINNSLTDLRILPKHIYENEADATAVTTSIGSGMYKLVEYKSGEYYKLEAMEDYFKGSPKVTNLNLPIMTDKSSIQQGIISGQLAGSTTSISAAVLDTFNNASGIEILKADGYAPTMLYFNCEREPFNNTKFRQAISLGVDMDSIIQQVALGHATKGTPNFIREDLEEAEKGLAYEYNVEKANQLLDELGYTQKNSDGIRLDANGAPLHFSLLAYSNNTNRVRAAELISTQLKSIGIDVEVTSMEATAVDDKVWPEFDVSKGRDFDMTMWGWSAPVMLNGGSLASLCASDYAIGNDNIGGYKNEEFDQLVSNYQSATTIEEANKASKEMQKFIANEYPFITLYYDDNLYACNTSVYNGWVASKSGSTLNVFSFLPEEAQK
ncbi:MAG: ABC transporter substrate-binding protein [Clostridium sp.]|nr:ABC transporter substrate-binding protein [Clostridium sp.]